MKLKKIPIFTLLAVILIVCVTGAFYAKHIVNSKQNILSQVLNIPKGASSKSISRLLFQKDIISSQPAFVWLTRWTNKASHLKPGLYHFEGEMSINDVLNQLTDGKVIQFKVTIPEGLRVDEVLSMLSDKTNIGLEKWQLALQKIVGNAEVEGLLLPETYQYTLPVDPSFLLKQMFDARKKVEADIAQSKDWNTEQISRNRIIASIVEKETALATERVLVSAAVHNRLQINMPLQMDPTVIYGIYRTTGSFSGNITRKDLKADTPWNTYTNRGLPKTPICNPGAESLRAAASPSDVDYLYFVADGTGGHAFASSLEEHNANVRNWIRIERKANK